MNELEKFLNENPIRSTVALVLAIALFAGIILLGRGLTAEARAILTPQKWQIVKAQKAYRQDMTTLHLDLAKLSTLLASEQPDPIQGQIITDAVLSHLQDEGQPALQDEYLSMQEAAMAVRNWSQGLIPYEDARLQIEETQQRLRDATIQ